jgi:spore germination cell wall hydrolase CwlJ-like protein
MTALAIRRRFAAVPARIGLSLAGLAAIAAMVVAVALLTAREPAAASVTIPLARANALVEATTGAKANEMQAVGDQAKLINAALPFAGGPIHAAQPFAASGSDLDPRRAVLCLTQAVYYEAGFEPLSGRRAVAQVVLNRLRHPAFPKSVCGVVYQGSGGRVCQFTFVCDGALYRQPAQGAWLQAEQVARAALAGYVDATVGEATHYHADYVAPRWAPLLAKVAQIGQHIFYRWPGGWGQPAAFNGRYIGEPRDPLSMRPPKPTFDPTAPAEAIAAVTGPVTDGTVLQHAPNDVGGLLDTTKGWTLNIPGPGDADSAAAKMIAEQKTPAVPQSAPALVAAAGAAGPAMANR